MIEDVKEVTVTDELNCHVRLFDINVSNVELPIDEAVIVVNKLYQTVMKAIELAGIMLPCTAETGVEKVLQRLRVLNGGTLEPGVQSYMRNYLEESLTTLESLREQIYMRPFMNSRFVVACFLLTYFDKPDSMARYWHAIGAICLWKPKEMHRQFTKDICYLMGFCCTPTFDGSMEIEYIQKLRALVTEFRVAHDELDVKNTAQAKAFEEIRRKASSQGSRAADDDDDNKEIKSTYRKRRRIIHHRKKRRKKEQNTKMMQDEAKRQAAHLRVLEDNRHPIVDGVNIFVHDRQKIPAFNFFLKLRYDMLALIRPRYSLCYARSPLADFIKVRRVVLLLAFYVVRGYNRLLQDLTRQFGVDYLDLSHLEGVCVILQFLTEAHLWIFLDFVEQIRKRAFGESLE
jgi:hypothetical protein